MVADRNPRHSCTDPCDDARALVAEHCGAPRLRGAVDRVLVRVTDAARIQAYEHLTATGIGELELGHLHRSARPLQDRGANLHVVAVSLRSSCSRRNSSIGMWQRIR